MEKLLNSFFVFITSCCYSFEYMFRMREKAKYNKSNKKKKNENIAQEKITGIVFAMTQDSYYLNIV